jgi:LmbE family N-acetylglucosaminyl deacetylase
MTAKPTVALAVVAHPDDVEFMMAGTLLLLREAGADIHIWNLANGCLGTVRHTRAEISAIRWQEAQDAARVAGATAHPPLFDDMAIFFDGPSLARVSAGIREIGPDIILTQPVVDYMEDHQNTARLVVSAAFSRGMPNLVTNPIRGPVEGPVAIYHALPSGLRGPTGERPVASHLVDIGTVFPLKKEMLSRHRSQKEWLDVSQGMDAYLRTMEDLGREAGRMSGRFELAEGFSQHWHLGYSDPGWDPLAALLGGRVHRG